MASLVDSGVHHWSPTLDRMHDGKFAVPALPAHFVARNRVHAKAARALVTPLTTVTAPTGAGKTTLFAALARSQAAGTVAWCTLDEHEGDAAAFGSSILRAVLLARNAGDGRRAAIERCTSPDPLDQALQLLGHGPRMLLVLDDVEALRARDARFALQRLVHHAPPELSLVLLSSRDPDIRIDHNELPHRIDLRGAEIAFTEGEASTLFARLDVSLDALDLATITAWTRGSTAALVLAATAMRHPAGAARVLAEARSGDRAIMDFLVGELLEELPNSLSAFVLRTSIVDRLDRDLAEAITGDPAANRRLTTLARERLFLSPVEGPPGWYRHDRLVGDLLRAALGHTFASELPELHRRAARHLRANGDHASALHHAAAGHDWVLVASIIIDQWVDAVVDAPASPIAVPDLPGEMVARDASCALASAISLFLRGDHDTAAQVLELARALPDPAGSPRAGLAAALLDLVLAFVRPNAAADVDDAGDGLRKVASDASTEDDLAARLLALAELAGGCAELERGDLTDAAASLQNAIDSSAACGIDSVTSSATSLLALTTALLGHPRRAQALNEELGAIWATERDELPYGTRAVTGAICAYHRDDLPAARKALAEARSTLPSGVVRDVIAPLVGARLALSDGDDDGAHRLQAAAAAAGSRQLVDAVCESLGAPAPRGRVAGRGSSACPRRAADGAHPYTRVGRYLESAVRNAASGDTRAAQTCLQRALAIVDRHGFRRALVDSRLPVREILTDYVGDDRPFRMVATQLLERMVADAGSGPSRYVETLTERELMVLGFLPTMMSNSEIAAEMFFSVNTVKTHLKSIYRKLEVSRRRDAVVRARELNLI